MRVRVSAVVKPPIPPLSSQPSRIASPRCVVQISDDGVGISHVRLDGSCADFVANVCIILDDVYVCKTSHVDTELDDEYEDIESDVDIEPVDKIDIEPVDNVDVFFDLLSSWASALSQ